MRRHARGALVLAAATALAGTLAGCGPAAHRADARGALESVAEHLDTASSAVATVQLAVDQAVAGRLPAVSADVAASDAAEGATDAVHGLGTIVVPDAAVGGADAPALRDQALAAAGQAADAVAAVRTWLDADGPPDALLAQLDDAAAALDQAHGAVADAAGIPS
ncbi:hypothetical protein [Puerhibacterium puerhi]|uniref:hypothetical protein n=1 Tax=Puerhibacterium puerhi TaxID=2692623 RepID=UPI0013583ED8|nr:hypothetical protein [Puerhibacterium puerhi]